MENDTRSSTDAVFEALTDQRRRMVVWFIENSEEEPVYFDEVSEYIAATLDPPVEVVQLNLHHKDLPKLERAGLVEYNEQSGAIRTQNPQLISKLSKLDLLDCPTQLNP